MNIGIYSGTIPPEKFIDNLIDGIAERGCKVFIYGKEKNKSFILNKKNIVRRKFYSNKLEIFFNSILYFLKLLFLKPRSFLSIIKEIRQNSISIFQILDRSCKILPLLLDNIDVLHIQWTKTIVKYPEIINNINCPVVLSFRGSHINYSPLCDSDLIKGYQKYFLNVSAFHAVSNAIAKEAQKYSADPNKTTVIYPAVKLELVNNIYKKCTKSERLKIISVGRCHWTKGYSTALEAMAKLKNKDFKFNYTIIASGKDTDSINFHINDLELKDCVTFINGLSHEKIIDNLLASDVFLLSSVSEGISNAVLEAMSIGLPVISTDCGGMREVIDDNKNGFLVPAYCSSSIVETIQKIYSLNEIVKENLIKNAKETIIKNHLINDQIDNFLDLYLKNIKNYEL
tara:strand:+ start:20496 stop:21692 length:1197 start_codon:yes stop_codon:yes gene_type:complete